MKREQLKDLGLTDEQIESIMKMHGQDVQKYSDYDELKAKNTSLTEQVEKNAKDLKGLSKLTKDNEELNSKITSLTDENKQIKADSEKKIANMKLDSAVNNALSGRKARNTKSVRALLDMDNVKLSEDGQLSGLDDQLDTIEKDNPFLFDKGQHQNYKPTGDDHNNDATGKDAFLQAWGGTLGGDKE
jgi:uncharacterized protein YjiS (DUF1127 family)